MMKFNLHKNKYLYLIKTSILFAIFATTTLVFSQQNWPSKPVKMIVPFPAGGSTDLVARYLAQGLSDKLGQQFIVENKSGAAGNLGTDSVAKSTSDGYTIGLVTSGPLVNNKFLYPNMPFDADKDLTPIALVCEIPLVVASNPKFPARNLKQFVEFSKAKPQDYSVGHPGNGTIGHLALEYFSMVTQNKLVGIAYRGDTPAMADLLGGNIQAIFAPITAFIPNISAGKMTGLAVTSSSRYPGLPDIPTAKEQGIDIVATVWFAIVGPANLPPTIVQKLNTEINILLASSTGKVKLQQFGAVATIGSPDNLIQLIKEDGRKWKTVIEAANIKAD
jgi:tripartite-type tricarboxylate transporter receptor subunit TctC